MKKRGERGAPSGVIRNKVGKGEGEEKEKKPSPTRRHRRRAERRRRDVGGG